jgi:drug/metabolite transporter (DMT)-like permease
MNISTLVQLVVLGMIWGASFMFQRITVPAIGAGMTGAGRMIFAALTLLGVLALLRKPLLWRERWRDYLLVGIIVMGLPLTCFAIAARSLPAGYLAVLNATTPLFAVLIGWARSGIRPSASKLAGIVVGVAGVATLAKFSHLEMNLSTALGFAAALFASFLYAVGAIMAKQRFGDADPLPVTSGNLIGGALPLIPVAFATAPAVLPSVGVMAALVSLGILCTGIAYTLYFRILRTAGVERTVTVTFLVPLFALLWAALFLHEPITWAAVAGCALVLFAVALIFEKVPGLVRKRV